MFDSQPNHGPNNPHHPIMALLKNAAEQAEDQKRRKKKMEVDAPEIERVCLLLEEICSGVSPTASLEARSAIRYTLEHSISVLLSYKES